MKKRTWRKSLVALFMAALLAVQPGCCTVIDLFAGRPAPSAEPVEYRWGCHIFGNIFFGGIIIGFLVDLISGHHLKQVYGPGGHLPDGDQNKLLAVHLKDGTVFILDGVHKASDAEKAKSLKISPEKILKTEWVMKIEESKT
jgi:hypothetical protein